MEDENHCQQICEIESLESIYTKEMKIVVPGKEYMIDVQLDIKNSLKVSILEPVTIAASTSHTPIPPLSRPNSFRNVIVSHLPPITLYIRYNELYPSDRQPYCHLSARWLNPLYADKLQHILDNIFIPGYPVVFDWVNYISGNLINDYCDLLPNQLSLEETPPIIDKPHPIEPHPIESHPIEPHPDQLLVRSISEFNDIEEYDNFEKHNEFIMTNHECSICFDIKQGTLFTDPCIDCDGTGLYCIECVTQYCQTLINEGRINTITCPYPACNTTYSDTTLKHILDLNTFDKYIQLREQIQLDSIPGMIYCPRTVCNSQILSDPASNLAVCDNCGFPFCKLCRQTWHGLDTCTVFDKIKAIEDGPLIDSKKNSKETETRMVELKSLLWFRSHDDVRNCPNCTTAIQKTGGCNRMTCWRCACGFCWLCNEIISGYGHFTPGNCKMYKNEIVENEVDIINEIDDINHIEELLYKKCPRCSQVFKKDSNKNWVTCNKCKMHFCLMCGDPCYGQYHFNEYGCKQYSTIKEDMKFIKETS